jgi:chromosome segregation ATPase
MAHAFLSGATTLALPGRITMEGSSMKYRIALAVTLFALSASSYANTLCQEKEHDIQREISYAEKHNNQSRINGLNKALSEVRANCSDSKLRAEHQKKIEEQKDEIAERKRDLAEAKQKGDTDKITKRERKLAEAQTELKELESRDY